VTDGLPHIATYVRTGDTVSLYVDGAPVVSQSALCPSARGNYNFQIGAMTSSSYFFNGDIAEIQLFDRALNSWEVMSLHEQLSAVYGIGGVARSAVAWGNNAYGQTNGPASLTNLSAVASGSFFNLALNRQGTVVGWGNNSLGQTSPPSGLTNVAALAAGASFGLALGNQPPWVSNTAVGGYVSHDLVLTLPGGDPDGNAFGFRVVTLPAAGALYQYANGTRSTPLTTPNTAVSDPQGRLVFAPAPNQTGSPYASFSFLAEDPFYSSGTAQVRADIGWPAPPQLSAPTAGASDAGAWQLNFAGDPNATYSLWASTNLVDWDRIGTVPEPNPGQYQFLDTSATNGPQRFYRVTAP
jgi:hypothetical protein